MQVQRDASESATVNAKLDWNKWIVGSILSL